MLADTNYPVLVYAVGSTYPGLETLRPLRVLSSRVTRHPRAPRVKSSPSSVSKIGVSQTRNLMGRSTEDIGDIASQPRGRAVASCGDGFPSMASLLRKRTGLNHQPYE